MLLTRVITALAILPVVLAMLFLAPDRAWALFALAIVLVGCWEWSRMCGFAGRGASRAFLVLSGLAAGASFLAYERLPQAQFAQLSVASFVAAAAFWTVAVPLWLALRLRPAPWACALAGWMVLLPTWAALVALHGRSPWILLATALLVWIADIAAYFAGRRFGRVKLAPDISPGKTREGVAGALLGVLAYGIVLKLASEGRAFPVSPLFEGAGGALAIVSMIALTFVSVVGDLFESWMKRGSGLKDSSGLLPGHGGVLDRIDALTSTLPVAALLLHFGVPR
jgi:phosphatidate cytidylyltransferase